jgi:protein-S-isoprenylcysteine O-methyltransferase Ste14
MIMSVARRFVLVQFILFGLFALLTWYVPSVAQSPLRFVSFVLVLAGIGIFVAAIIAHQQTNQMLPKVSPNPHQKGNLVTSGIYQIIRHPIYTAVLALTLGIAIYHGSLVVMGSWLVLVVFFWVKSDYEESLLKKQFANYVEYRRKTARFVPGINI